MDPVKPAGAPRKPRIATAWLGGCSGCHMSFVDLDERLIEIAARCPVHRTLESEVKIRTRLREPSVDP